MGTFVSPDLPDTAFLSADQRTPQKEEQGAAIEAPPPCGALRTHRLADPERRRLAADFWVGRPDARSFPLKAWSHHIKNRLKAVGSNLTSYNDAAGLMELRRAIAKHLAPARGVVADPEQIVIVGGCQDGFNLVGRLLVTPGSTAVVESPCYQGAAFVLESLGATLYPVPVDQDGLDVSRLPKTRGAVAYVTPSHQYPIGVTMSLQRRLELLAWATQYDAYIMEDDYDSDFRFIGSPLTALKGLDRNERVIYLGTFSKLRARPAARLCRAAPPSRRSRAAYENADEQWPKLAGTGGDGGFHVERRIRAPFAAHPPAVSRPARRAARRA